MKNPPPSQLGQLLVKGVRSDLYAWGEKQVVKLLDHRFRREAAERERDATNQARELGLPVPQVGEIVTIHGRHGIVFEKIYGATVKDLVLARPWTIFYHAGMLAKLHAAVHSLRAPDLPRQRRQFQRRILTTDQLSRESKVAGLRVLARLAEGDTLCHGDLHSANVLLSSAGPYLIDWSGATRGNPVADVAITSMVLRHGHYYIKDFPEKLIARFLSSLGAALYLREYTRRRPVSKEELRAWRPVLAAARLSIQPEARALERMASSLLAPHAVRPRK